MNATALMGRPCRSDEAEVEAADIGPVVDSWVLAGDALADSLRLSGERHQAEAIAQACALVRVAGHEPERPHRRTVRARPGKQGG